MIPRMLDWFYTGQCGVVVELSVRTIPTRGPGEERTNVLGSLSIQYFKHHYSFIVLQLFH